MAVTTNELMTEAEATTISSALDALEAIERRASDYPVTQGEATWKDFSRAYACGRVAEAADTARDVCFGVLSVASNVGHDEQAAKALRLRSRSAAGR